MNVTAQGTIDRDSIKALNNIMIYGKKKPLKRLIWQTVLFFLLAAVLLIEGILWGFEDFMLWLIALCLIAVLMLNYLYFILPLIRIRQAGKSLGCVNRYEFTEEGFTATSDMPDFSGTSQTKYAMIKRVYETDRYLFLIMTNNAAFIIEKSTLSDNEDAILQKTLQKNTTKYIRCQY